MEDKKTLREKLAEKIINGASMHRVASRIIHEVKANTSFYRPIAAAKLAFIYDDMPLCHAMAVIQEMDIGSGEVGRPWIFPE